MKIKTRTIKLLIQIGYRLVYVIRRRQLVPRPPHWSGRCVRPDLIEFWFGVRFRLHERHRHEWRDGAWHYRLLYP